MSCVWCGCIWLCFWHKSVHQISWAINSCSASCRDSLEPTSSEIGLLDSERNHLYIDFWGKKLNTSLKKGPPTNHHQHLKTSRNKCWEPNQTHLNVLLKTTTAMGPAREDRSSSHVSPAHALGVNVFYLGSSGKPWLLIRIYREKTWIEPFVCVCVCVDFHPRSLTSVANLQWSAKDSGDSKPDLSDHVVCWNSTPKPINRGTLL